jgi:hypothetical protein
MEVRRGAKRALSAANSTFGADRLSAAQQSAKEKGPRLNEEAEPEVCRAVAVDCPAWLSTIAGAQL